MDTLIGDSLGQYRITGVLGRGGMATVYRATQERLGRDVAVKVLRDTLDPQAEQRFDREARAVASLSHPNILPVYDYGEDEGRRYIVTQYIEGGRSLERRVAEGPVPPAEAAALTIRVLEALAYAHGRGVIHRDIKPANILLPRPDWPLLGDFGIAQSAAEQTQLTSAGEIIGTPNYMAPERATGQPSDARADLYAVGVVLYELLTGRPPFAGDGPLAVLLKHVQDPPPPPHSLNPAVPAPLEQVVLRALEKEPARRFQSAAEMADALRAAATPEALARSFPGPAELGPWPDSRPPSPRREPPPYPPPGPVPTPRPTPAPRQPAAPAPAPRPAAQSRRLPRLGLLLLGGLVALLVAGWLLWGRGGAAGPLTIEDGAWSGGYNGPFNGGPTYGGRTPVVAYGQGSDRSEITASFSLAARPRGNPAVVLHGMDSEGPAKTEIVISVNGITIYNGENPLPDDDFVLETGTWDSASFPFDRGILREGENSITIINRSPGRFGGPPFIIIDYATIVLD
jgi:hypothetical protein